MKYKAFFIVVLCIIFSIFIVSIGFAAIYKYTDKDDMIHFVDDLQSVPEQYRSTAKIVNGEEKAEIKKQPDQYQPSAQEEAKKTEVLSSGVSEKNTTKKSEETSFSRRAIISAIIIVSALFAFVILGMLEFSNKKVIAITRIVIIWGVSVFLLYAHAGDVLAVFSTFGSKIEDTQKQAEEKGKKAAKAVKTFDALIERVENVSSSNTPDTPGTESENKKQ